MSVLQIIPHLVTASVRIVITTPKIAVAAAILARRVQAVPAGLANARWGKMLVMALAWTQALMPTTAAAAEQLVPRVLLVPEEFVIVRVRRRVFVAELA